MVNHSPISSLSRLEDVATLVDMLAFRAQHSPDKEAFIFEGESVSYERLWDEVNRVASFLMSQGVNSGDRVVIIFPNGTEFFSVFYGIQRAGAVSVPIFPGSGMRRALSIFSACAAKVVIVPSDVSTEMIESYRQGIEAFGAKLFTFDECLQSEVSADFPPIEAEQLAFLQYTSGSTGNSKGVMLTHKNLIANLRQMIAGAEMTEAEVLVSWLPVYHDLGLILMTMAPFYLGARLILLPTALTRMSHWLNAIMENKGTLTAAPDVGYRQVIKQTRDPKKYDLSSLRIAVNAAEPIRAQTVRDFEAMFGLEPVTKPSYGLAEASVGVTFWGVEAKPIKVDERGNVAIGYALPDVELKIIVDDRVAEVGEVGEIVFKSPSGTQGYFRNPEATDALFWQDGYIRTGDLAYWDAEGDLFLVARKKNIIKHSGRTISPREIEEIVDDINGVRYSAALGINRGDLAGEQAYVFAESRLSADRTETEGADIVREIVRTIHQRLGFRPGRVYLVAKHTIPFTYNGKIQHVDLKRQYMDGELASAGKLLYPKQ